MPPITSSLCYCVRMKIIFLNTWKGQTGEAFLEFVRDHASTTDIFCFQEAHGEVQSMCSTFLPDHMPIIAQKPSSKGYTFDQVTYLGPTARLLSSSVIFPLTSAIGFGLYTEIAVGDIVLHVVNFHGSSHPVNKLDDDTRLQASREIIRFMSKMPGPKIIGGDFNLLPETHSIQMFEEFGYHNLIRLHNISTTRNRLAWRYAIKQDYADYVFTSGDVGVKNFSVPKNEVSDHLPLILEI